MQYRRVGNTHLEVSEIGFGCGGNAGLMVRGTFAEQREIVASALDLGINYFDTAPDYGDAEAHLGRVLRALDARPVLASKVEIRAADLHDIAGHVVRSTEASLRRLGVDCIDVLQIHNGPVAGAPVPQGADYHTLGIDYFTQPGGALDGLRSLVDAGKVRYTGFNCRGDDAPYVLELLSTGMFSMLNVSYTLLNPTAGIERPAMLIVDKDSGRVLDHSREAGVGMAVYSVLARGFLSDQGVAGEERHPLARSIDVHADNARETRRKAAQTRFLADETGITLAQAAFRFVLAHSGVTTALGGFSSLAQLQELCAVSGMGPFAPALTRRLEEVWRNNFGAA